MQDLSTMHLEPRICLCFLASTGFVANQKCIFNPYLAQAPLHYPLKSSGFLKFSKGLEIEHSSGIF